MKKLTIFIDLILLLSYPVYGETYHGIDVSEYQGSITWSEVAQDGIDFAMTKATEGNSEVDPYFYSNVSGATENGIMRELIIMQVFHPSVMRRRKLSTFLMSLKARISHML